MTISVDKPLVRNKKRITARDFVSLSTMFAPSMLFGIALVLAYCFDSRFCWLANMKKYPWELWMLTACGIIATAGGLGDWIFHRVFVTVGPREHRSHMLA